MNFIKDLETAKELGIKAFFSSKKAVPAMDADFVALIKVYSTSTFEHTGKIIKLITAWNNGWHSSNLSN